jgi:hypothetical protein
VVLCLVPAGGDFHRDGFKISEKKRLVHRR